MSSNGVVLKQLMKDGLNVFADISSDGHVVLGGQRSTVIHFPCQITEEGLTFNPSKDAVGLQHVSFSIKVDKKGTGITLTVISGPGPLWSNGCAPLVRIYPRVENSELVITAKQDVHSKTQVLKVVSYREKWKPPWTFDKVQKYLDNLPERYSDKQTETLEEIANYMASLAGGNPQELQAAHFERTIRLLLLGEQERREKDMERRYDELCKKVESGKKLTRQEKKEMALIQSFLGDH